jgi:hypothetical protein
MSPPSVVPAIVDPVGAIAHLPQDAATGLFNASDGGV